MTTSAFSDYAARLRRFMERSLAQRARQEHPGEEEFNALALELHRLQFTRNAVYRRLCEARGSGPERVQHWSQIPPVPTSAFKELELTSLPGGERQAVFCSSGTSGQAAGRHFHNHESLALYETSLWSWFRIHLLPEALPQARSLVMLTPPASRAPHSSLVHMFETVARELERRGAAANFCGVVHRDGGWSVDQAQVEDALERATRANRPVLLLGTAFNYVHLLEGRSTPDRRRKLPAGSRLLETGGYKGRSRAFAKAELYRQLEDFLGLPQEAIVSEYGMCELSSQAFDTVATLGDTPNSKPNERVLRFPPWARVRVVSPETGFEVAQGETGLIRVWDLANVWSVLAVQTEDLGARRGDGFELIGRAALAEPRGCSLMAR